MALTKAGAEVQNFTAVASLAVDSSTVVDCADNYETSLHIQAAVDASGTATHDGTKFIVQVSASTTGDEDWANYAEFTALEGTLIDEALTAEATAPTKTLPSTAHDLLVEGVWNLLRDATLANSEMIFIQELDTDDVNIVDNIARTHAATTTDIRNIAMVRHVTIQGTNILRARLLVDNRLDPNAINVVFRLSKTVTTLLS